MSLKRSPIALLLALLVGSWAVACGGDQQPKPTVVDRAGKPPRRKPPAPTGPVTITVIGTNDLHGSIRNLPYFGGYMSILRNGEKSDGVVLLSGGDMFQGTLESNIGEGEAVIEAYNHLGYTAAAIGNHEFDFGPAGPKATPEGPDDDPRGAVKARAAQASFPFLGANIVDETTGKSIRWPNTAPTALVRVKDVRVGIIGIATESTPQTTIASNVVGLRFEDIGETIEREARRLRDTGAEVILVTAHAGARCAEFEDPNDISSCDDEEIIEVAKALPPGTVDAIIGGHTHQGVAHYVNGIAIIESFARGRAFGRIDVTVTRGQNGSKVETRIHPPRNICKEKGQVCEPGEYEGVPVEPDPVLTKIVAGHLEKAQEVRSEQLGVTVEAEITRSYSAESPLGNLVADLMFAARPGADIAMTNGGGIRANLPAGPLSYGSLFEVIPFDNRFATVKLRGRHLRRMIRGNLEKGRGILLFSGIRATATCRGRNLIVDVTRADGRKIRNGELLTVVTSDFLATGGDGAIGSLKLPAKWIVLDEGPPIRDQVADVLRARGGTLTGALPEIFDPASLRVSYPGERPVSCK